MGDTKVNSSKIFNEDCISGAKRHFDDKSVDLVICDPPFGIDEVSFGKHYFRDETRSIEGYVEAPSDYYTFSRQWIEQASRILKDSGSMYIISGWSNLHHILRAVEDLGLYQINHIIWKYNFGVYTSKKFVTSHYHILYLKKSKNSKVIFNTNCRFGGSEKDENGGSLLYQDMEDVWYIKKEYQSGKIKNKNKLPSELLDKMILYSSNPGDVVCDFFLGNFTTAFSAKKLGRIAVGFEANKNSFNYFHGKLEKEIFGSGLRELRKVPEDKRFNKGKKFSSEEKMELFKDYEELIRKGLKKKEAVSTLTDKYGRGKWSIERVIKSVCQ